MPRGRKKRWAPRGRRTWFERNRAYLLLGLTAVAVASLVTVALNSVRVGDSSASARSLATSQTSGPTPLTPVAPVATFIGDSYVQGTGASDRTSTRWTTLVSNEFGWDERNLGRGGTGFVAVSTVSGCGLKGCPNFRQMVVEAASTEPEIVVVGGGQNDFNAWIADPEPIRSAITGTFADLRAALPASRIVAVGPSTTGPLSQTILDFDLAVQVAASAVGAEYVSLISPNAMTPEMAVPGFHVNDAGHRAIADAVINAIR